MNVVKNLELDKIINIVKTYSTFEETKDLIDLVEPSRDKKEVERLLLEVEHARASVIKIGRLDVFEMNVKDTIERLRVSAPLSISEIFEVLNLCDNVQRVLTYITKVQNIQIEYSELKKTFDRFVSLKNIKDMIYKVIDSDGNVLDNASLALYQIRHRIRLENQKLDIKINQLLESLASKLSDTIVTIRNGRKVIPIKVEYKNQVQGVVQGESASGQTVFIEPFQTIEIENKIESLKEEEAREVSRILYELSVNIANNYETIEEDYSALIYLDFIMSKAYYAVDIDAVMPKLSKNINIIKGRHPLIDKEKVVANTIKLNAYKTMIITGPNTGGKTVVLKTLGLLALMTECGMLIPCEKDSEIPVFDGIYSDIGDEQSIEQSLSTFSSHMNKIVEIIDEFSNDSLILLDELGSGTDPKEGASLAIAIIDHLSKFNVYLVVTTHYPELKNYAYLDENIVNASVEFDVNTLKPTYRLLIGFSGKSNAFLISERLGLRKAIIDHANEISQGFSNSSSNLMEILEKEEEKARLEKEKYEALNQELTEKLHNAEIKIKKDRDQLNKEYETLNNKRNSILFKAQNEADRLINEITALKKKLESNDEVSQEALSKIKKKTDNLYESKLIPKKANKHEIKEGDNVRILEYNKIGTVIKIKNNNYSVQIGSLIFNYSIDEIEYEGEFDKNKIIMGPKQQFKAKSVKTRLDLRGLRYEEAQAELEKFIDDVTLENIKQVEIIHGYGTLALRNMVIKFAEESPLIKSYRPGEELEGGRGVTVMVLK